jgi:predicted permease
VVFIIICVIMMVITVGLWTWYLRAQKLRRKQLQEYQGAASSPV